MNRRQTPLVSIILCTYNRAALLPAAVRSVQRQTVTDWELIIIDDGSTDGTERIVRRFISEDARIRYHYQPNAGLARARNEGMRRSVGAFLCFVDSDDELRRDHLSLRLEYLTLHPRTEFIHGGMKLIGPRSKHYVVDMTDTSRKIHLRRCHIGGTFFFRRSVRRHVRTFRPIPFGEDFDFYTRVARRCRTAKVAFPTYLYHLDSADRLCDIHTARLLK
ncbi:MAG: glycosyltransferase family 2 protein [Bacteroidetes bacterium]|nr:glycosyltransferase family 2 protein [Bacteroidota bacterium]